MTDTADPPDELAALRAKRIAVTAPRSVRFTTRNGAVIVTTSTEEWTFTPDLARKWATHLRRCAYEATPKPPSAESIVLALLRGGPATPETIAPALKGHHEVNCWPDPATGAVRLARQELTRLRRKRKVLYSARLRQWHLPLIAVPASGDS